MRLKIHSPLLFSVILFAHFLTSEVSRAEPRGHPEDSPIVIRFETVRCLTGRECALNVSLEGLSSGAEYGAAIALERDGSIVFEERKLLDASCRAKRSGHAVTIVLPPLPLFRHKISVRVLDASDGLQSERQVLASAEHQLAVREGEHGRFDRVDEVRGIHVPDHSLHGSEHPPMAIKLPSTPLVYRGIRCQVHSEGHDLQCRKEMELRFYVTGALPFFAYKVIVHEVVSGPSRLSIAEPFWLESASSSEEVVMVIPLRDDSRESFRFLIEVVDLFPGLGTLSRSGTDRRSHSKPK